MKKGYAEPLLVIGKVYAQKEMYNKAIGCWQRILEFEPDNAIEYVHQQYKSMKAKFPISNFNVP